MLIESVKNDTRADYSKRILRVLVHIQQHMDDALDLEELARVANFSPFHFHRIFKAMVGESVMEHVRRLRLERAAVMLKSTRLPVTRLAFEAGYETLESFIRAFKTMFGDSPSVFRKQHRSPGFLTSPSRVHYAQNCNQLAFKAVMGGTPLEVVIKKIDPIRVAFVRHVGPYAHVGAAWERLCAWAGPKGLLGSRSVFLGVCYDDPEVTPPEKIRYDACVSAPDHVKAEGEVGVQDVGGGKFAVYEHKGPYEGLTESWHKLAGEWLARSGQHMRQAPSFEIYLNSPDTTPPQELRVELCMPLEE